MGEGEYTLNWLNWELVGGGGSDNGEISVVARVDG